MNPNNEELNTESQEEPAFRPPKVENFRTLQGDLINAVNKQDKSLTEMILSAKKDKWEEQQKQGGPKKVYIKNKYRQPLYKIVLLCIVIFITILFSVRIFLY